MADFVARDVEDEKYRRFRAVLVGRDETLREWVEKRMEEELHGESGNDNGAQSSASAAGKV